jgi:L-xylulose reductase
MSMTIDFSGKRALVTGAGKGIGRETARLLSELGATVVALSRTAEDLESLTDEIGCETVQCDLADVTATRRAAETIGDIDLLVNNAGMVVRDPVVEAKVEVFDKIIGVNLPAIKVV